MMMVVVVLQKFNILNRNEWEWASEWEHRKGIWTARKIRAQIRNEEREMHAHVRGQEPEIDITFVYRQIYRDLI